MNMKGHGPHENGKEKTHTGRPFKHESRSRRDLGSGW